MNTKLYFILAILFLLFLVGCGPSEQAMQESLAQTLTALPTKTNTLEPTATFTLPPTQTLTFTLTPTKTFTLTPTIYTLSLDEVLAQISIQEEDLKDYYQEINVSTDGFVDGSIMEIERVEECNLTSWSNDPENAVNSYCTYLNTNRVWEGRMPLWLATHSNAIKVFDNAEDAHDYFVNDISNMEEGFKRDMQTIGDESVMFTGYKGGTSPLGGVIWRYKEVYFFLSASLKYQVTPDSLITIAENIQSRLVEALN